MKTSYEMVFHAKPDVSELVHFFSPGVYHLTSEERKGKSLAFKAEPCRMLGYSSKSKNTYIVLNTKKNKVFERRDVVFDESYYQELVSARKIDSNLDKLKELFIEHGLDVSGDDPEEEDQDLATDDDQIEDDGLADEYVSDEDEEQEEEEEEEEEIPQRVTRFKGVRQPSQKNFNMMVESNPSKDSTIEEYGDYLKSQEEYSTVFPTIASIYNLEKGEYFMYDDEEDDEFIFQMTSKSDPIDQSKKRSNAQVNTVTDETNYMERVIELPYCPQTIEDALACPEAALWIVAILKELRVLDERKVFELAKDQRGRGMKTKMVFRVNYDNNFNIKRKARLVCCGYSQIKGVEYDKTYSPTASTMSWMILIQWAAENGFFILGFDITSAFLLASNDFENHAHLPASLVPEDRRRVRVLKAWYGEKQAPKLFYELLNDRLETIGYIRCPDSPCLFAKFSDKGGVLTMISIYVDDGFVASKSKELPKGDSVSI
jgi:hypothetical protein